MPPPDETVELPEDLPIPPEQAHYADPADNPQRQRIRPLVDHVQYPTLGCPALLGPGQPLQVLASLPEGVQAGSCRVALKDRHGGGDEVLWLEPEREAERLTLGPGGDRRLWRLWLSTEGLAPALYDLALVLPDDKEVQYNAVRIYAEITGQEKVVLCGDSQYNVDNRECLERFVAAVNELDVAWIALIGDVCDNGVKNVLNLVHLVACAGPQPVTHYYGREFPEAHRLLRKLRHPIVLVPGNHDGMVAYHRYGRGEPTDVYLGPDPANDVEYDGLHHYRRTFGPLYYRFDWGRTRYLCCNSFELDRHQRLGYHAVVANWGGWMREEQLRWVRRELDECEALGQLPVVLIHHDPRGGSEGEQLGYYHPLRDYTYDQAGSITQAYIVYALRHGWWRPQQEWMEPKDGDLAGHPVQKLMRYLVQFHAWAVVMGHDNECWVDSYYEGNDLFRAKARTFTYATRADVEDEALVDDVLDLLESGDYAGLHELLAAQDREAAETALSAALHEVASKEALGRQVFAAGPAEGWGVRADTTIHFVHVDDVGAYEHEYDKHFAEYGFVLVDLDGGRPSVLQRVPLIGARGERKRLPLD